MRVRNQKGGKGCLLLILGTLAVIAVSILIFPTVTGWISHAVIESALGGKTAYALLVLSLPCIIAAYVLLNAILILRFIPSEQPSDEEEVRPMLGQRKAVSILSKRTVNILTLCLAALVLLAVPVSAGTYRTVSEEGISTTVCFIPVDSYRWDEVDSYTVDCDTGRGLSITFTMKDGRSFEILQNTVSSPVSFEEQYPCKEAFAVHLLEKMDRLNIPRNVTNKQREAARIFYEKNEKLWPYVKEIVGYTGVSSAAP